MERFFKGPGRGKGMNIDKKDLKIIKEIEGIIGVSLKLYSSMDGDSIVNGLTLDKATGRVTGLNLNDTVLSDLTVLAGLTALEELYIYSTEVTDLSPLEGLASLKVLNVSDNRIDDLEPLKGLSALTGLYLNDTDIKSLTPLQDLTSLTELYISHTLIDDLTPLEGLTSLTGLYLNCTGIMDLTPLAGLFSLTGLAFDETGIKNLTPLKGLTSLIELSLEGTGIKDLTSLSGLTSLAKLNLNRTGIDDLTPLAGLTSLKRLNLTGTGIDDLTPLAGLTSLNELNLKGTGIKDLTPLKGLTSITHLFLADTGIANLTPIEGLRFIRQLNICHTKVTTIPERLIVNLTKAAKSSFRQVIYLEGAPITSPPLEIINQGTDKILEYYRSLKDKTTRLNEVKVILLGDGGAGKTSVMKQLMGKKFKADESKTHGINICSWEVGGDKDDDKKVHFWDFGGQEIMHATHQCFLSSRSFYIIVLDGRREGMAEYWLKHVAAFGGDSPVFVVVNKIDDNPSFAVDSRFLQEKYENIINDGFFRLSCLNGEGVGVLKKALLSQLDSNRNLLLGTEVSTKWLDITGALRQMEDHYITKEQYIKVCRDNEVAEEGQRDLLLQFLHDLGVMLHFKRFDLKKYQILEPKWITEAVYKIINSAKLAGDRGILNKNDLEYILNEEAFDEECYDFKLEGVTYRLDEQDYIISLMEEFKLCYSLDAEHVMVPDLLPKEQPDFSWDPEGAIAFLLEYDFFPRSVMPRFIVEMNGDIVDRVCWRTGVLLREKVFNSQALVIADNVDKKIAIVVKGGQKREYLACIRKVFADINGSFEQIGAVEKVPCGCGECVGNKKKHYFDYALLIKRKLKGGNTAICGKSAEDVSIDLLLEGVDSVSLDERILNLLDSIDQKNKDAESIKEQAKSIITANPSVLGFGVDLKQVYNIIEKYIKKWRNKKAAGKDLLEDKKGPQKKLPGK